MIGQNVHLPKLHLPQVIAKPALLVIKMSLLKGAVQLGAEAVSNAVGAVDGLERQRDARGHFIEGSIGHLIFAATDKGARRKLVKTFGPQAHPFKNPTLKKAVIDGIMTSGVNNLKAGINGARWNTMGMLLHLGPVTQIAGAYGLTGTRILGHNLADRLAATHGNGTPEDANMRVGLFNTRDGLTERAGIKAMHKAVSLLPLLGVGDDPNVTGDQKYTLREVFGMSRPADAGVGTSDGRSAPEYLTKFMRQPKAGSQRTATSHVPTAPARTANTTANSRQFAGAAV